MFNRFTRSGNSLTRRVRHIEKKHESLERELLKLKNKTIEEAEILQERSNSERDSAWRQLIDNQELKDFATLSKYFSLGLGGASFGHSIVQRSLSEDQQKALVYNLETSYAIIEQQTNNCYTMDYWSVTEEKKIIKLKTVVEEKKPRWKFWA